MPDDEYVFDEASGEWVPAGTSAATAEDDNIEVRDAVGNLLADGDQVTLIKDLNGKGAGQTLKRGTLIKSIRLTGDPQEIDCSSAKVRYKGAIWHVILAPVSRMEARGLTKQMIGPRSVVVIEGYPRRDGAREMRIERVTAGGKTVELR